MDTIAAALPFARGRIRVRLAGTEAEREACFALRHLAFHGRAGRDVDGFDADWPQIMIERDGELAGTFRLRLSHGEASGGYAGQFYDLCALDAFPDAVLELGRFCLAPTLGPDSDVLRVGWAALARIVEAANVGLLFGCSSFPGTDPARHRAALARLGRDHAGPAAWPVGRRSSHIVDLPCDEAAEGDGAFPPLLRSYFQMGGWVSDHAVIDPDMQTIHVFTAVEIARIPPVRARALRALAGLD
ncbi:GNAT family N-acetyltransferase [Loktanella sp. IMCC34160]|uniref:GNAT family N-acetyltransferase n=1 Tax=Loktanella sp. IMCC34160 TaxID=2510646 RepID=UPI00101DDF9D|nr:GNAT family N-acetyltransferase [Loktanella sp. IMCC34160]RYG92304.1 GNAT family N-acetyltransferase [Loktanella sp. IMCC34160]